VAMGKRPGPVLSAIRAAAAAVGRFPLFAVLVHIADEHPAVYADVGALVLVVVFLGRWLCVGCARLCVGHEVTPSWSGPRELVTPRGHLRCAKNYSTPVALPPLLVYT
jgi:hypothetical protein